MERFTYGLHKLTERCFAFIQPNGSWGLSNTGLIVHKNEAVLIDTLYDLHLTRKMLEVIKAELGSELKIVALINTHANGDHWYGNGLVECGRIISTKKSLQEMRAMPPSKMAVFGRIWRLLGGAGKYFHRHFGQFQFKGIEPVLPNETFEHSKHLSLGGITIELREFTDTHTLSDTIAAVPGEKVVFAADLLFANCTPLTWTFPLKNWIDACDVILAMDVDIIVPGHGPVSTKKELQHQRDYFLFLYEQVKPLFKKGMSPLEAALSINLGEYEGWGESERAVFNVFSIYRELNPSIKEMSAVGMFKMVDRFQRRRQQSASSR